VHCSQTGRFGSGPTASMKARRPQVADTASPRNLHACYDCNTLTRIYGLFLFSRTPSPSSRRITLLIYRIVLPAVMLLRGSLRMPQLNQVLSRKDAGAHSCRRRASRPTARAVTHSTQADAAAPLSSRAAPVLTAALVILNSVQPPACWAEPPQAHDQQQQQRAQAQAQSTLVDKLRRLMQGGACVETRPAVVRGQPPKCIFIMRSMLACGRASRLTNMLRVTAEQVSQSQGKLADDPTHACAPPCATPPPACRRRRPTTRGRPGTQHARAGAGAAAAPAGKHWEGRHLRCGQGRAKA
jgi:hypothetical protein